MNRHPKVQGAPHNTAMASQAGTISSLEVHYCRWQYVLFVLHYASAIAVVVITEGSGWEVPVLLRYNVWKSQNGQCAGDQPGGCTIHEFERVLPHKIQTGFLVASFSFVSGLHHLIAGIWCTGYIRHLVEEKGVSLLRWFDYSISASCMLALDSLLWFAPPSVTQLVLIAAAMFLVITAGLGSEVAWSEGRSGMAKIVYVMAMVAFVGVWSNTWMLFIEGMNPKEEAYGIKSARGMVATENKNNPPNFVYIIFVGLFVTYLSFPIAHLWRLYSPTLDTMASQWEKKKAVIGVELVYSNLSFLAKIPLLAVYASGVSARDQSISIAGFDNKTTAIDDADDTSFMWLGITVTISVVLATSMWWDTRHFFRKGSKESLKETKYVYFNPLFSRPSAQSQPESTKNLL